MLRVPNACALLSSGCLLAKLLRSRMLGEPACALLPLLHPVCTCLPTYHNCSTPPFSTTGHPCAATHRGARGSVRAQPPPAALQVRGRTWAAEADICTAAVQMQWAPVCSYMLFGMGRCSPLPQVAAAPWQFTDEIQPAFASQPAGTALITWRKKRWTLPPALARPPSAARLLRPSRQQQKRAPPGQQAPLRRQPQMCRTACHASPLQ